MNLFSDSKFGISSYQNCLDLPLWLVRIQKKIKDVEAILQFNENTKMKYIVFSNQLPHYLTLARITEVVLYVHGC